MAWNPSDSFSLVVLAIVAIRESLLLITGLGAKRRANGTAGGQSLEASEIRGKRMVAEIVDERLRPIQNDLDELLERRRRRR